MLSVSPQPPRMTATSPLLIADDASSARMDQLLANLRRSMVELILQGDDVTRQMWQMYTVFGEIFGLKSSTSKHLKPVVVGDRFIKKLCPIAIPSPENKDSSTMSSASPSPASAVDALSAHAVVTDGANLSLAAVVTTPTSTPLKTVAPSTISSESESNSRLLLPETHIDRVSYNRNKVNQRSFLVEEDPSQQPKLNKSRNQPRPLSQCQPELPSSTIRPTNQVPRTSNPLLDTIGALAGSNPDSDDSDLDIVYQQLRYRGRHRRPEQVRIRTQRSLRHHHQHFASSDPESIGYAGSNSIDSGYKSLCATPEVSDSLSAPEVRRSASDVSASDSSTTSGRPRSSDGNDPGKSAKIKMGTRVIAGKIHQVGRPHPHPESPMRDVTLDHLMYLRQSLRKDRQDYYPQSSQGSMPSSSGSSTIRDDISPCAVSDEESVWSDKHKRAHRQIQMPTHTAHTAFVRGARREGRLSLGSEVIRRQEEVQRVDARPSSDFLLSGVEYYDLDSVQDFPPCSNYVTMLEEKTRCSRLQLMAAPKREVPLADRQVDTLFKKKKESPQVAMSEPCTTSYGVPRRSSREGPKPASHRHHHHHHHSTDSKLTEAAIRVLEMIEDFRMEEAIENMGIPVEGATYNRMDKPEGGRPPSGRYRSNVSLTSVGPHAFVPRFRRTSGPRTSVRPASTGSLIGCDIPVDTRSIASSSYAASAEHHVYEEIMYDLVCERSMQPEHGLPPMPPDRGMKARNRLLPVAPLAIASPHGHVPGPDLTRMMVRSHKHRSNLYSAVSGLDDRRNMERFLEMEWHMSREQRGSVAPDFPV